MAIASPVPIFVWKVDQQAGQQRMFALGRFDEDGGEEGYEAAGGGGEREREREEEERVRRKARRREQVQARLGSLLPRSQFGGGGREA